MRIRPLVLAGILALWGCQTSKMPAPHQPSATEVFNLRQRCADLGERYLKENRTQVTEAGGWIIVSTNYSVQTNRCYLTDDRQFGLTAQTLMHTVELVDGQTTDMLALTSDESGVQTGQINNKDSTFEIAKAYIEARMKRDDQ